MTCISNSIATTARKQLRPLVADVGELVPSESHGRLADALDDLLAMDAEQRAQMGTRGREKILEKYSWRDTVRQTTNVYRELLDGKDQATPQPVTHQ